MEKAMKYFFAFVFSLVLAAPAMAADNWKDDLKGVLSADLKFARTTSWATEIKDTSNASTFRVKLEGLTAELAGSDLATPNYFANGAVTQEKPGVSGKAAKIGGFLGGAVRKGVIRTNGPHAQTIIKAGEIVYPVKVTIGDDEIGLLVVTASTKQVTTDGTSSEVYFQSFLHFLCSKEEMRGMTPEKASQLMSGLLERQGKPATTTQLAAVSASNSAPTASNTSTSNSLIGKSTDELRALLGAPDSTLDVSGQTIFVYSQLGVRATVRDGKVVAAQ